MFSPDVFEVGCMYENINLHECSPRPLIAGYCSNDFDPVSGNKKGLYIYLRIALDNGLFVCS